jgi:hypothetical protein
MIWFRLARLSTVIIGLGLSACVTMPGAPVLPVMPSTEAAQISELLERFERVAGQSTEEQKREFAAAQTGFERAPTEQNRLRLALAFSLPQASWRDDARVISLLAEWVADPNPTLRRDVAQLLYRLTVERQRLMKEEQRRLEGVQQGEQKRAEVLLHDERKKVEDLQQKLDALREIDRNTLKPSRR